MHTGRLRGALGVVDEASAIAALAEQLNALQREPQPVDAAAQLRQAVLPGTGLLQLLQLPDDAKQRVIGERADALLRPLGSVWPVGHANQHYGTPMTLAAVDVHLTHLTKGQVRGLNLTPSPMPGTY